MLKITSFINMKIYAMYLMEKTGDTSRVIDSITDFSDVGFFYRGSAVEICDFFAKGLAASPSQDRLTTVQEQQFMFHKMRNQNIVTIIVTTQDYPSRVAFGILREMMNEYLASAGVLLNGQSLVIRRGIREYQQPRNADKITKITENLQETQMIMTKNLQMALARGETLEQMLTKAEGISDQARLFARESKKLNRCCSRI
jgi:synaptobrevin family protein YKT6